MRNGNFHTADGFRDVLDPVIARYSKRDLMRFFFADADANLTICMRLEEASCFDAIRLRANAMWRAKISHRLTRPVEQPSKTKVKRFYADF